MIKAASWFGAIPLICILLSCNQNDGNKEALPAAEAFNEVLSQEQLDEIFNLTAADSSMRMAYVYKWIKQKAVLNEAKQNVSTEEINQLVEDYKSSLIIHQFENQYVDSRLNKAISEQEFQEYVDGNPDEFKTNEELVRVMIAKLPEGDPGLKQFKDYWNSNDMRELSRFCRDHELMCYLEDSIWYNLSEIEVLLPSSLHDQLQKGKNVHRFREGAEYFVKTLDKKVNSTNASLEHQRENINQRILFYRKEQLLITLRDSLYKDAIEKKRVKIYPND